MDYGLIGKIEKAKRYAEERDRITFNSLTALFSGDNSVYTITMGADGWDCTCSSFRNHSICTHVMSLERMFKPMLKREPLSYSPGQNVVSDVEKSRHYAEEPERIQLLSFEVSFRGDNGDHITTYSNGDWECTCEFFQSRDVCCHTMAMERILGDMIAVPEAVTH